MMASVQLPVSEKSEKVGTLIGTKLRAFRPNPSSSDEINLASTGRKEYTRSCCGDTRHRVQRRKAQKLILVSLVEIGHGVGILVLPCHFLLVHTAQRKSSDVR